MSRRLLSLAMRKPSATSSSCWLESFGPAICPGSGRQSSRKVVAGRSSTPALFQLIRDGRKNRLGVPFLQPRQQQRALQIGQQIEEISRRDLPRHDGLRDLLVAKIIAKPAQLPDAQPGIMVGQLLHLRRRLARKTDDGDPLHAPRPRRLGQQDRIAPVAGDDAERFE